MWMTVTNAPPYFGDLRRHFYIFLYFHICNFTIWYYYNFLSYCFAMLHHFWLFNCVATFDLIGVILDILQFVIFLFLVSLFNCVTASQVQFSYFLFLLPMDQRALKNVTNYLNTNIYSYLETSGGQSSNLFLNIAHFLNTIVN